MVTALKSVKVLLGDFNLTPESIELDNKNNKIRVCINDNRISHIELAYNLNKKYLKGSINNIDGKVHIEIAANYANVHRLQLIHRGLLQTYGDKKDYKKCLFWNFRKLQKNIRVCMKKKPKQQKRGML